MTHTFHIPVLGLGYSIDTPLKVARYGISSVISIVDDIALERIRKFYSDKHLTPYVPIAATEADYRAKRITAYLNRINDLVEKQFEDLKQQEFKPGTDLIRYFELLPPHSSLRKLYGEMLAAAQICEKARLQHELRKRMAKGAVDVNIMSKVDKMNWSENGEKLPEIYNDALAALRGFANSNLNSSVILSAGMNPRLYSYLETFRDFLPDERLELKKRVILKVSDFRSAFIQAKFLVKKGIWVSEFRVESGLNCGGHAFATEGYLLGPVLEEFKNRRTAMTTELFSSYQLALQNKGIDLIECPPLKISFQGGIGTAEENDFLLRYYQLDATGWGSPFLLVPEATNVDEETLKLLSSADEKDFYISGASPLGIPFNNFRKSSGEMQRLDRIAKNRPGSPCNKKYLVSNTEFTTEPICTASRTYQHLKIKELEKAELPAKEYRQKINAITEKVCLCEGLVSSFFKKHDLLKPKENKAVTICPGPNLAYFKGSYSLEQMVNHIYGKMNLLDGVKRPHLFLNELKLYIEYLEKDMEVNILKMNSKKEKYIRDFSQQLQNGINYYKEMMAAILNKNGACNAAPMADFFTDLKILEVKLESL